MKFYTERFIWPRGGEILQSYSETVMFDILNTTVMEVMEKYSYDNSSLIKHQYDNDGNITSFEVDYNAVNKIKSEISTRISDKLSANDNAKIKIPLGSFSKNMYFYGKGPKLSFTPIQRGLIQTDFEHEFISAGINQTMHTLKITMESDVALVIPYYDTITKIKTSAILCQIITNGNIPEQHYNLIKGGI